MDQTEALALFLVLSDLCTVKTFSRFPTVGEILEIAEASELISSRESREIAVFISPRLTNALARRVAISRASKPSA